MSSSGLRSPTLSLFRIVVGLLFTCHGIASIFGILGGAFGTGKALHVGVWPGWWAAAIQCACGGLVLVGLVTRPAAVLCSGSMAYAYFVVHQQHALLPLNNGGELPVLFCWSFLLIAVLGAGDWSLDAAAGRLRRLARQGRHSAIADNATTTAVA